MDSFDPHLQKNNCSVQHRYFSGYGSFLETLDQIQSGFLELGVKTEAVKRVHTWLFKNSENQLRTSKNY